MQADYNFAEIVNEIAAKEDIKDVTFKHEDGSKKGDNYLGVIKAVQVIGSNKKLDLIFKYPTRNLQMYEIMPLRLIFLHEIKFYKAVPLMIKFQNDHAIEDVFTNVPKSYLLKTEPEKNELLVLENLRTAGYELWNRKEQMDRRHLELALETFAKFHGISFAMRKLQPELFKQLVNEYVNFAEVGQALMEKVGIGSIQANLKSLWDIFDETNPTEKPLKEAFINFTNNLLMVMNSRKTIDQYSVITQGDSWCNNLMFKRTDPKDPSTVTSMKILDFQLAKLGSVILDLSYFFYSSASKEALDDLNHFRKHYHSKLGQYLKQYNIDVEEVYPFEEFISQWKKYSGYGLACCSYTRKVMICDSEEAADMNSEDANGGGKNFLDQINVKTKSEDIYRQQFKEVFVHFYERDFCSV